MSKKIRELQAKKADAAKAMRAVSDKVTDRPMTAEEQAEYDGHKATIESCNAAIAREQELIEFEANSGVVIPDEARIEVRDNKAADPTGGFRSFGEFAALVRQAAAPGGAARQDPRLASRFSRDGLSAAAPTTFGNEAGGQDGGFAVPPQYATEIFTLSNNLGEESLLPLCENVEIESNSMAFPKDETTPWGTDGIRAYWQAEANAGTQTKPKLGLAEMRMKKLLALVPITDELLADAPAVSSWLPGKLAASIRWKTNESILFGTGSGTPQGAFNSGALITVPKETGQATLTLLPQNVAKMVARLPAGSYRNAIWLINNDVLPALFTLTLGNYPIYLPGGAPQVGGIQMNPYGTLLGRPIVVSQHAKSFSSQGDVLLADLSYYRAITKAGGVQMATSLHLYFDADATAFRATFRMDGQSKIVNPISPANGSNSMSPFVQLGAR